MKAARVSALRQQYLTLRAAFMGVGHRHSHSPDCLLTEGAWRRLILLWHPHTNCVTLLWS